MDTASVLKSKVSIVMATLHAEKHLAASLQSIARQTYPPYELLIVDGGSTDGTRDIIRSFPKATLLEQQGTGLFDAWNQGIRAATGDYIAFLDSDDHWEDQALEWHIHALLANQKAWGSVGKMRFFLEPGEAPPEEFKRSLLEEDHLGYMPGCFLGKKEVFEKIGYFETDWKIASDIVWFSRFKELSDIALVDKVVLNKRVHQKNISYASAKEDTYSKELLSLLHQRMKRQ